MICHRCKNELGKKSFKSFCTYGENIRDHKSPCSQDDYIFYYFDFIMDKESFRSIVNFKHYENNYGIHISKEYCINKYGRLFELKESINIFDYKEELSIDRAYYLLNRYLENLIFE